MKLKTLKPRLQVLAVNRVQVAPPPSQATDYRIRGRELQRIRQAHLRRHPLCVHCLSRGFVQMATEVDHILAITNGGVDSRDPFENRQGLCTPCHDAKTAEDLKAR